VVECLASGRTRGGTDGRRGSAGCGEDLRVWARSAGEGSPAAKGVGARRDHADGRGREDSPANTKGSRDSLSFFGVCVNVCGRRLSIKVKPFKCCRVSGFIRIILLCAFGVNAICVFELCAFCVSLNLLVNCSRFASSPFLFIDSPSCFT